MEPMRARPVPFCRQSFFPEPCTSLRTFVAWVPARWLARYHREASCRRCGFTFAAKTPSASSTWPTFFPLRFTTSTTGIRLLPFYLRPRSGQPRSKSRLLSVLRLADHDVRTARSRHRSAHQKQILVRVHFHDFEILCRDLDVPHVTREVLVLPHARGERARADAARRAMEHGAVRRVAAAIVPAFHAALEAAAFAHAADIDELAGLKAVHQHAVANLGLVARFLDAHFTEQFHRRDARAFVMARHSLVHALRLDEFDEAQLHGVIAVFAFRAALDDHARSRLQHRASHQCAVWLEHLGHPQLDSENSVDCHSLLRPRFQLPFKRDPSLRSG